MSTNSFSLNQVLQYSHIKYRKRIFDWNFIRDALEGETAIKFKNELYLPMPTSMVDFTPNPVNQQAGTGYYSQFWSDDYLKTLMTEYNPNFHRNSAYSAYLSRAQFPELPGYVLRGLLGLALKQLPTITLPSELEYLNDTATAQGSNLVEYFTFLLQETLTTGRVISTYDMFGENIYFVSYKAEDCINWKYETKPGEDRSLIALRLVERLDDSFDDPSLTQSYNNRDCCIVEMRMIGDSYMVRKAYDEEQLYQDWVEVDEDSGEYMLSGTVSQPSVAGNKLDYIPAIAIGSLNNEFDVDPSPMFPIANSSKQIYMKSADLSQSEYMSCSPMLVMTGVNAESAPSAIGSSVAIAIPNPEAKVFFTETDTSALSHVKNHMDDLFTQAIQSGAQLLDTSPKPAETAETTRLKQAASTATLLTSVRNVATAIEKQLKEIAKLKGADPEEVSFIPNTEFIAPMITAAEIRELVQSWVNGALSKSTVLENFKRAGIINEATTIEDEMKEIEEEEANLQPGTVKYNRLKALFDKDSGRGDLGKSRADMLPSEEETTPGDE